MILLIAATEFEIASFINYKHEKYDVLITGVGAPAALFHLQKRLHQLDYDLVIQAGIAGSFNNTLNLGEVVLIEKDTFGDIGMEEKNNFTPIFKSGFVDENEFPFENGWLKNNHPLLKQSSLNIVSAVTINKVSDSILQKDQLIKNFNPGIESMEGAAFHYVCLQENIPFVQIRSISNHVGERDKTKWKMKDAITNLNTELGKLVESINH
jgi:futalosine hydrolase